MLLTVLEWNVQDFFIQLEYPLSEESLQQISEDQWQLLGKSDVYLKPLEKIRQIADVIFEVDADVVCLCEVGGLESLQNFAELFLNGIYEAHLAPGNSDRGIESGFLVKTSLGFEARVKSYKNWPVNFQYAHEQAPEQYPYARDAARYYELGQPNDRKLSRDAPALSLKKHGKTSIIFLLTHLKSGYDVVGIDPEGKIRREAEFRALLSIRESIAAKLPDVPIVMLGDFNGIAARRDTAQEFLALYQQTDYEDVLELVNAPTHERITQVSFIRREVLAKQLDYVLLPPSLRTKLLEAFVYRYHEDEAEIGIPLSFRERRLLPSDHYPIVVRLEL